MRELLTADRHLSDPTFCNAKDKTEKKLKKLKKLENFNQKINSLFVLSKNSTKT